MNCPTCNTKGGVKDTRQTADGTMRRYTCAAGHKWQTSEQVELVYDDAFIKANQVERGQRMAALRWAAGGGA